MRERIGSLGGEEWLGFGQAVVDGWVVEVAMLLLF